ncbi:serine/arginine repetitive matrix protein 1-like [Engraulis encrasicolus]|uniref:serine/arginine repetitive matrix protein 1-like n=1 Tax=Engraulis encrasicolus TaxID=184585 RepID=UPI002FD6AC20
MAHTRFRMTRPFVPVPIPEIIAENVVPVDYISLVAGILFLCTLCKIIVSWNTIKKVELLGRCLRHLTSEHVCPAAGLDPLLSHCESILGRLDRCETQLRNRVLQADTTNFNCSTSRCPESPSTSRTGQPVCPSSCGDSRLHDPGPHHVKEEPGTEYHTSDEESSSTHSQTTNCFEKPSCSHARTAAALGGVSSGKNRNPPRSVFSTESKATETGTEKQASATGVMVSGKNKNLPRSDCPTESEPTKKATAKKVSSAPVVSSRKNKNMPSSVFPIVSKATETDADKEISSTGLVSSAKTENPARRASPTESKATQAAGTDKQVSSTFPNVKLFQRRSSPRRRWRFAIWIVRIVVMLLPERLRSAEKDSSVKFTRKAPPRNVSPQNVSPQKALPRNASPQNGPDLTLADAAAPSQIAKMPPRSATNVSPQNGPPPNASLQNGPPPNASLRNGPPPNASLQNGLPPNASLRNGPPPNASLRNGPPPNASLRNGPPPNASLQNGLPPNASLRNGPPPNASLQNGLPPNASLQNGRHLTLAADAPSQITKTPPRSATTVSSAPRVLVQKLEYHLRCKLNHQSWGFPEQLLRYMGKQAVLDTGKGKVVRQASPTKWKNIQLQLETSNSNQNVPRPTKTSTQPADHPRVSKNPVPPISGQWDNKVRPKMDAATECNLGPRPECCLWKKHLEDLLKNTCNHPPLHSLSTSHQPDHITISADGVTVTPMETVRVTDTATQPSIFYRINEANQKLKKEKYMAGKQTPNAPYVEQMEAISNENILTQEEGRAPILWFSRTTF